MSQLDTKRPLIIGEVLFDCFGERRVLGGAPFNVAWNSKGLGLDPLVLTAVGKDDFGDEVLQNMREWNLDTSGVEVCHGFRTGRVDIQIDSGQPTYTFLSDVAFDHIGAEHLPETWGDFGLLYHGSLATRASESRATIHQLRSEANCPVFIDVNIRLPHFSTSIFEPFLLDAEHVKLNDQELTYLMRLPHDWQLTETDSLHELNGYWRRLGMLGRELMAKYGIRNLWLTAGQAGAAWFGPGDQQLLAPAPKVSNLVDTVGAGDALAAVIIRSILIGQSPGDALPIAVDFAARVCTLRGAITRDKEFYRPQSGN